jgi:hydrogenase maturation protease
MSRARRVLVAGIGNIFLGDDGFGVEVARRLRAEALPDGVEVSDFGIRGVHLAFELADGGYEAVILVDAARRGGPPGTLYVIEPDAAAGSASAADGHSLTPDAVLAWLRQIGAEPPPVTVVACEPAFLGEEMALSPPVAAAVAEAMRMVRALVANRPERSDPPCV